MASSLFPQRQQNKSTANDNGVFSRFMNFAKGMSPQEAEKRIDGLLRSGQMTKEQFNALASRAKEFMNLFGLK